VQALGRREFNAVLSGLMARYRQKALNLAVSLVRDSAVAEDLAQEAFVKVWRSLPRYDGRASLSTWLYTIVRNTCWSELRGRRRTVSLDDSEWQGLDTSGVDHSAESAAAGYDVQRLLGALPEPSRRVMVLYYLEERSCEDVAEMLAMPVGTVKSLLFRARKILASRVATQVAQRFRARG